LLYKTARILIQGSSKMEIKGSPTELKPLFQNIQAILDRRE
jgi:hypothetical protein